MAQPGLTDPSLAVDTDILPLEATAKTPVATQRNTPSTDENTEERTTITCTTTTCAEKQQPETLTQEPLPPTSSIPLSLALPLLLEDVPSIKWTAINEISDAHMTDSSSAPNTEKKQVSDSNMKRVQNMNNIYSTYSRGYRAIPPSPDSLHQRSSSLVTSSQPKEKLSKSSSSPSILTTATAVVQSGRDLIHEQTTLRRRFRNQVSKAIGNSALLVDTCSISHGEGGGGGEANTADLDTPVCPFTQDKLDAKYRDAIQIYLQEHYSSSEAISTILEKSVWHFRWCCAMWDYVPVGNSTVEYPSTPQKEVTRLVKELKKLEKEYRSTLPKAEDTSSGRPSLSRLQTPALSICSSTFSSAANSPALKFSTPSTPAPRFELDSAYTVGHFGSAEQYGLGFDGKTEHEVHEDKDNTKDGDNKPIKDKKSTKGQIKDQAKDTAKVKAEDKGMNKVKAKEHTKGKAKENTKSKVKENAKENTKEKAKGPPGGQKTPEPDIRILKKGSSGGETPKAAKLSTVEKTSDKSEEGFQRDVPTMQNLATDAPQKSATQGIDKETSEGWAPQDQPPVLTRTPTMKNDGRDPQSFEEHLQPPKRPLDDGDSSTSISSQDGQPNHKRKLWRPNKGEHQNITS
ncbi:hypothetical protein BGZ82_002633 [Podila clonocystis]|nr:hypothetical protein BGZ82_002633 [Podila clonocystis]